MRANLVAGSGRISGSGRFHAALRIARPLALSARLSPCLIAWLPVAAGRGRGPARTGRRQAPQPLAMMPPSPAGRHIALRHRPDRASDPDRGIDVDDPDDDRRDGRQAMDQHGDPLLLDRRVGREIDVPDHDAGEEQHRDQQRHRPEDELLRRH